METKSEKMEDVEETPVAPRAHKKSRRGCKTCKVRKIKCDEAHPLCNNCRIYYQGAQDRCEYDGPPTPIIYTSPTVLSSRPKTVANQHRKRQEKGQTDIISTTLHARRDSSSLSPVKRSIGTQYELNPMDIQAINLDGGKMDPFHTHPPTPEPEPDALLQHYFQTTVYTIYPFYPSATINPQAEFYSPLIYTDPLLYHVTLQLSALHLEKLQGSKKRVQSKRLMGECLRLLKDRVDESGAVDGRPVSDETIAGVAGLVGIEHEKGNVRMVQLHMRGLQRMVSLRGGLNALRRSNGMIANIVFCTFAAVHELPFPHLDLVNPWPKPCWYHLACLSFEAPFYTSFESYGVPVPYAAVLQDIRIISETYQQGTDCSDSKHYLSVLVFLFATLQQGMSLPNIEPLQTREYWLCEAVRSALILHIFHIWCGIKSPDPSLLVSNARQNLKSSIKPLLIIPYVHNESTPLLLWFACVGAVGSPSGSLERRWFAGHVIGLMEMLGIPMDDEDTKTGYDVLKSTLRGVIWHELQDEPTHRVLWTEMQEML